MPQRNLESRRSFFRLFLFLLAGGALLALSRRREDVPTEQRESRPTSVEPAPLADESSRPEQSGRATNRSASIGPTRRRLAASVAFTTLFFAGAAFSAGAGDQVANLLETPDAVPTLTDEEIPPPAEQTTEEVAGEQPAAEEVPPEEVPAEEPVPEATVPAGPEAAVPGDPETAAPVEAPATDAPAGESQPEQAPADGAPSGPAAGEERAEAPASAPAAGAPKAGAPVASGAPLVTPYRPEPRWAPKPDPEAELPGASATIWLHRALPDPTPPARRLSPAFAKRLTAASTRARVDWALVLGVLRARGRLHSEPATAASLNALAKRLRDLGARTDAWQAVLALSGRTAFADRAVALSRYNRAVGLRALVTGLEAAKPALEQRTLRDPRIDVYPAGRGDIASGRIDVRVLVLVRYLAEAHGQVTVSSLHSGHRLFARPGVVSAHAYGLAVDISALGNTSIAGNQEPGSVTERAVRNILLLPTELRPQQVISLLGMGGPSFPLADHYDHIHVGY